MIKKAYFEITNVCNLNCSFCPKTKRTPAFVSLSQFNDVADKLKGRVEYLYLHLMGEPTLHPELEAILESAGKRGFKVILTTNGTALEKVGKILVSSDALYKISMSLHSREANDNGYDMDTYLNSCFDFALDASEKGKICVFRLWNLNGEATVGQNSQNPYILERMRQYFGDEWTETRSGARLQNKVFLEYGEKFEWPDPNATEINERDCFCHGLRDQIGILCDGTVVPCCLDSEGTVALGNIFTSNFDEIISSKKAKSFYKCFTNRKSPSALCSNCGYARRFSRN